MGDFVGDEAGLRAAVFAYLDDAIRRHGDVLPWRVFAGEFRFHGRHVVLASQRGIHKPKGLDAAISIMTTYPRDRERPPYEDAFDERGGVLRYAYQGRDPSSYDNQALRACLERELPIVYLVGVSKGFYIPIYPVFIVAENPGAREFEVSFSPRRREASDDGTILIGEATSIHLAGSSEAVRGYQPQLVHRRLHQAVFRQRVLRAYRRRCAICQLNQAELIEAAHIVPDRDALGDPVTRNGLALCRLHHAAYDRDLLGIRPARRRASSSGDGQP